MFTRSSFRLSAVALALAWLGSLAVPEAGPQDPPLIRAAGQPYVNCDTIGQQIARMEAGMAPQHEALRRSEEMLKAAEAGRLGAPAERRDVLVKAAQAWLDHQEQYLDGMAKLAAAVPAARVTAYRERLQKLKTFVDGASKVADSASAGYAYGKTIDLGKWLTNTATAASDLATFLSDSGLADEVALAAAKAASGPVGLVIEGFTLARDWSYAELQQNISDAEVGEMRDNYYAMRAAVRNNEERIANMRALAGSCSPPSKPAVQESPKPIPPDPPAPPPPQPAAKPPRKNTHVGRALLIALPAAGAAAYFGGKAAAQAMETAGSTSGSGSGSGSSTPSIVDKHEPWICSGNRCTGQLTINFPGVMNSGTITVGTNSLFLGQRQVSPTSAPGTITFSMEKSPYVTCYGTQTSVGIWNGAFTNTGPAAYTLTTSIRVECR